MSKNRNQRKKRKKEKEKEKEEEEEEEKEGEEEDEDEDEDEDDRPGFPRVFYSKENNKRFLNVWLIEQKDHYRLQRRRRRWSNAIAE